jgi:hypothetical protein
MPENACLNHLRKCFASVGTKQTIRRLEMPVDGTGDVEVSPEKGRRGEESVRMVE